MHRNGTETVSRVAAMIQSPPSEAAQGLSARFADMTNEQLDDALNFAVAKTAEGYLEQAFIIREMESRGRDTLPLKKRIGTLYHHLRKIACGQLLPEVVRSFAGQDVLIAKISNLPLPDQKRLVEGDHLEVVVYRQDGTTSIKKKSPHAMTAKEISQVFSETKGIRNDVEQASYLDGKLRSEIEKRAQPGRVGNLELDVERESFVFMGKHRDSISAKEMRRALAAMDAAKK